MSAIEPATIQTQPTEQPPISPLLRNIVSWAAVGGVVVVALGFVYGLFDWASRGTGQMTAIAVAHFPAVLGLPFAALAALCLVLVLEAHSGAIEFEALGFKFRGASGPVVLWVMCFLAIVLGIKVLW
ncbi:MAG: hypothetical protein AB1941_03500 [Gemmatimonadota bacterium]